MSKSTLSTVRTIAFASPLLLLNACAHFNSGADDAVPECYVPPKVASKFDTLLAFAVDMSNMPSPARTELCHGLIKRQKEAPDNSVLLQLLVGRTLSDACGDIGKLLDQVDALPATAIDDEALRQFVGLQKEVLKNMHGVVKKLNSLEKKKKKSQPGTPDNKEPNETISNETRLLREKLDAIRSMEKQLDGSSETK